MFSCLCVSTKLSTEAAKADSSASCNEPRTSLGSLCSSTICRVIEYLPRISRKQLRLTNKALKTVVDQHVSRLMVSSLEVQPTRFPFLKDLEVDLWRNEVAIPDIIPILVSLPKLKHLRSVRVRAMPPAIATSQEKSRWWSVLGTTFKLKNLVELLRVRPQSPESLLEDNIKNSGMFTEAALKSLMTGLLHPRISGQVHFHLHTVVSLGLLQSLVALMNLVSKVSPVSSVLLYLKKPLEIGNEIDLSGLTKFTFIASVRLDVDTLLLTCPGFFERLSGCKALRILDVNAVARAATGQGQEPTTLQPQVAAVTASSGLKALRNLPYLEHLTIRGEVTVAQCGFEALSQLNQLKGLTLYLKLFVTDDDLAILSTGCHELQILQISRLKLLDVRTTMQLNTVTSLNYYLFEGIRQRVAAVFPNLCSATCRDWPARTDPFVLEGVSGLTSLTLIQHSLCHNALSLGGASVLAHINAISNLITLKTLVFKNFTQCEHLGPLTTAIWLLPYLSSLTLVSAQGFKPNGNSDELFSLCKSPIKGSTLKIQSLTLDTQGSSWHASKVLVRSSLPLLRVLVLKKQQQSLSLQSLVKTVADMPNLVKLELVGCHGPGLDMSITDELPEQLRKIQGNQAKQRLSVTLE